MQRYRYDDSEPGERDPLDNPNYAYQSQSRSPMGSNYQYQDQQQYPLDHQQTPPQGYYYEEPVTPSRRAQPTVPGAHPDSSFNQLRANRQYGRDRSTSGGQNSAPYAGPAIPGPGPATTSYRSNQNYNSASPIAAAPPPPPHRALDRRYNAQNNFNPNSNITPGADNFSESAAGGMAGIAYTVAERNARESGVDAMNNIGRLPPQSRQQYQQPSIPQPPTQVYSQQPLHGGSYDPSQQRNGYGGDSHSGHSSHGMPAATPGQGSPSRSQQSDPFADDPYQGYSRNAHPRLGVVDPNDIVDDGDEGLEYRRPARNSLLSLSNSDRGGNNNGKAVAGGAAAGGVLGAIGAFGGRSGNGAGNSGNYGPVNNASTEYQNNAGEIDLGGSHEKSSDWLEKEARRKKKWTWCIIIGVAFLIAGGIAGGVVGGLLSKKNQSGGGGGGGGQSAGDDTDANGDLNINSSEIKKLLNNKNIHKVFPGVDYTALNTQYPECLHNPPSQNNVTRDVAVLSQMTNTIRMYGTDCNQTQMLLHSIKQLEMQDTIKVWLGVWQDGNATTNERQLQQMWDILDEYGTDPFKGLIVANEILFREEMTEWDLGTLLEGVRTNLSAKGMDALPVATSDLGDKWTATLAAKSDYIMANIHPFFGGIGAANAAEWTWSFWDNHNSAFFKADKEKNVISEIGWPSQGGTNCGSATVTDCPDASVAGISQLNQLMEDWVCSALDNQTNYFWFEAFDEPWKVRFKTAGKEWEDHWGLMDIDRNLKPGIKIPDCGGKTV